MSTLAARGGEVHVRIGGNTQDYATLVDYLDQGRVIDKLSEDTGNPTDTPPLLYTRGLFYMMSNISNFVPVKWYLGQYHFLDSSSQRFKSSFWLIPSLTLLHRYTAQRYIKPAITGRHGGREDPW